MDDDEAFLSLFRAAHSPVSKIIHYEFYIYILCPVRGGWYLVGGIGVRVYVTVYLYVCIPYKGGERARVARNSAQLNFNARALFCWLRLFCIQPRLLDVSD